MNVFVDTSAFYAALSRTDSQHEKAVEDWNNLMNDRAVRFYTSNYVVVESCSLIRNRLGDNLLRSFLESLLPLAAVLWVNEKMHAAAISAMIAHGKNGPSLVDCSSFAVMREAGITKALAYDKHFAEERLTL